MFRLHLHLLTTAHRPSDAEVPALTIPPPPLPHLPSPSLFLPIIIYSLGALLLIALNLLTYKPIVKNRRLFSQSRLILRFPIAPSRSAQHIISSFPLTRSVSLSSSVTQGTSSDVLNTP